MDFFEAQEAARRRTTSLVALFVGAVLAIIAVVYAALHVGLGQPVGSVDPVLLLQVGVGVVLVVAVGSVSRTASLRKGGPAVAELLGARRVATDTSDGEERQLVNIVEEMSIASGTPVPAIYLVEAEESINAFAAGYTPNDAAIAVTRGALRKLTRDELQGVIAHEFSHILNGDMRLNIRLIGLLFGILLLAVIGRGILQVGARGGRGGRDRGGAVILLLALALLTVGYLGVFFGRLIKAAVSRQREYLADSAAVEFTRNPDGLAGALKKIATEPEGSRIHDSHAEELSHLFFANGLRSTFFGFLATHPPIDERIRRLDPSWSAGQDRVVAGESTPSMMSGFAGRSGSVPDQRKASSASVEVPASESSQPRTAAELIRSVGAPTVRHLEFAASALKSLPSPVARAVHDPAAAPAVVFALLAASGEAEDDSHILNAARDYGSIGLARQVEDLIPQMRAAGEEMRLPILDLVSPTLRTRPPADVTAFLESVERAVLGDGKMKLLELTLLHILRRRLRVPDQADRHAGDIGSFRHLRRETAALLSVLAWVGSDWRRDGADSAFRAAVRLLPSDVGRLDLIEPDSLSVNGVDEALSRFERATHGVRRTLLEACAESAIHDRRVTPVEAELVVAICEALDCPVPPVLHSASR